MFELSNQIGHELFSLTAARAVADSDNRDFMLANELFKLPFSLRRVSPLSVRVDNRVFEQLPRLVENGELTPGSNSRVDGQDLLAAKWRLKEQASKVLREDMDGMVLRPFGEFASNLAFEPGKYKPFECILDDVDQQVPVRVVGDIQVVLRDLVRQSYVGLDPDAQNVAFFTAVDRQDAVRRDLLHRLLEVEVRLVFLSLPLRKRLDATGDDEAGVPGIGAKRPADVGRVGDHVSEDVLDARQDLIAYSRATCRDRRVPGSTSARLATAGSRFQIASASGPRPFSRASVASDFFFGLNGR